MRRFRAFLVWAAMFAVLFQGYAAASMVCAPAHADGSAALEMVEVGPHDHGKHHHAAPDQDHSGDHEDLSSKSADDHKCGTCSACHAVALTTTQFSTSPQPLPDADLAEPFIAVASTSPGVLDKPPRA